MPAVEARSSQTKLAKYLVSIVRITGRMAEANLYGICMWAMPGEDQLVVRSRFQKELDLKNRRAEWERNLPKIREAEEAAGYKTFAERKPTTWLERRRCKPYETFWEQVVKQTELGQRAKPWLWVWNKKMLRYVARWINLMEKEIAEGAKLSDVVADTSIAAGIEGVAQFELICGVFELAVNVWENGDELKLYGDLVPWKI